MQAILTITGKVQGVFYRREVQAKALALGLAGYTRNNRDGSVTVCVQGETDALEELIEWSWKEPEEADVDNVEIIFNDQPEEIFTGFEVR